MRILHTSDWHLGKTYENISRLEEQRAFIDELCEIAEREEIQLVLVAGDIFDTYTPSAAAEELFYNAVDRLSGSGRRAVLIIAGNHDSPERLCAAGPLAFRNGIILLGLPGSDASLFKQAGGPVRIVDAGAGWLELSVDGCDHHAVVITLPYPSEARLERVLSAMENEDGLQKAYSDKVGGIFTELSEKFRDDTVNLAISHIFLLGGKESDSERVLQVGGAMTVDPSVLPKKAHFTALGHLHRPQRVKDAPCPAFYSGSPLAYSFSEAGYAKTVFRIDAVPGKPAEIKEIFLSSGKPLVRWIAKNGIEEAAAWCREGRDSNAWVDLEVHTDRVISAQEQKELRDLHPGIVNIRPVILSSAAETADYTDRESRRADELFRNYYRHKTGTEIAEDLMAAFLDMLNPEDDNEADAPLLPDASDREVQA